MITITLVSGSKHPFKGVNTGLVGGLVLVSQELAGFLIIS